MDRNANRFQRVFLSYASEDRVLANDLRQRLLDENIDLWQDIISMRGGADWWRQITDTLRDDRLRYLVLLMTYSPGGTRIVSASYDNTLKVWNAEEGQCLATFYTDAKLNGCSWSPVSNHIVAVGDRGVSFLEYIE